MNLQDFAAVVIINLAVSLFVALFFVPSMIEKIGLKKRERRTLFFLSSHNEKAQGRLKGFRQASKVLHHFFYRFPVHFTRFYTWLIRILCRWRVAVCILLVLLFGLPVFLLPEEMEGKDWVAKTYNKTLGSSTYKEKIKPIVNKALGGSLRLFVEKVYEGSYFTRNEEVVLTANATLPNGSTLEQMNVLIKKMEAYLSQFKEIKQFQTSSLRVK